ncbi:hypothetical protein LCGC14_0739610 [marine sediment metagenome]|uniref:Uncharacterized protein n=1 Tax=marine sediment metagenome TaxID=412755 RepID=A0A0F9QBF9_9ZZZZ
MPKLTLDTKITIHFDYYKEGFANQDVVDITEVETPTEEDLEEWIWELKDEWKEN